MLDGNAIFADRILVARLQAGNLAAYGVQPIAIGVPRLSVLEKSSSAVKLSHVHQRLGGAQLQSGIACTHAGGFRVSFRGLFLFSS